jgi:hypothetical protein
MIPPWAKAHKAPAFQPAAPVALSAEKVNPFDALRQHDAFISVHPQLAKSVNTIFYSGDWEATESSLAESKVYNTWEHYLQGLKPAWNGNRRLAIDVPGNSFKFHHSDESTPWTNGREAQLICDLVKGALAVEAPENGVRLTCANFLVVGLYGAESGLITEKLFELRIKQPEGGVMLENIPAAHDTASDVVLLSIARNVLDRPLAVGYNPGQRGFKVAISRAEQSMVVMGNIRVWCQEKIDENELVEDNKGKMSHFGAYIEDIIDQNDGISWGDVQRFLNKQDIFQAEFPKLIRPKIEAARNMKRKKPKTMSRAAFNRRVWELSHEIKRKHRAMKSRRSQNPKSPNVLRKKAYWAWKCGRGGGRGGRGGGAAGGSTAKT